MEGRLRSLLLGRLAWSPVGRNLANPAGEKGGALLNEIKQHGKKIVQLDIG